MSGPTSARTAATSCGEHTSPRAPDSTASAASRRTASDIGPSMPIRSRSARPSEVSTVTAAIGRVRGALDGGTDHLGAARRVHGQQVRAEPRDRPGRAGHRGGDVMQLQVEEDLDPTRAADRGHDLRPVPRYSSSPTLTVLTCGVTSPAHRAAVSRSGASSATAIGAGWVNVPPSDLAITLQRAPGEPSPRRGVRLVGEPDDVRHALDAPAGQFLLEFAQDARRRRTDRGRSSSRC